MNNTQRTVFFQAMNHVLQPQRIGSIVINVVDDIHQNHHPDNEIVTTCLTAGDLRSVGAFWQSQLLVNELVGVAIGRIVALTCNMLHISVQDDDVLAFVISTDELQGLMVELLVKFLSQRYGQMQCDHTIAQSLIDQVTAFNMKQMGKLN